MQKTKINQNYETLWDFGLLLFIGIMLRELFGILVIAPTDALNIFSTKYQEGWFWMFTPFLAWVFKFPIFALIIHNQLKERKKLTTMRIVVSIIVIDLAVLTIQYFIDASYDMDPISSSLSSIDIVNGLLLSLIVGPLIEFFPFILVSRALQVLWKISTIESVLISRKFAVIIYVIFLSLGIRVPETIQIVVKEMESVTFSQRYVSEFWNNKRFTKLILGNSNRLNGLALQTSLAKNQHFIEIDNLLDSDIIEYLKSADFEVMLSYIGSKDNLVTAKLDEMWDGVVVHRDFKNPIGTCHSKLYAFLLDPNPVDYFVADRDKVLGNESSSSRRMVRDKTKRIIVSYVPFGNPTIAEIAPSEERDEQSKLRIPPFFKTVSYDALVSSPLDLNFGDKVLRKRISISSNTPQNLIIPSSASIYFEIQPACNSLYLSKKSGKGTADNIFGFVGGFENNLDSSKTGAQKKLIIKLKQKPNKDFKFYLRPDYAITYPVEASTIPFLFFPRVHQISSSAMDGVLYKGDTKIEISKGQQLSFTNVNYLSSKTQGYLLARSSDFRLAGRNQARRLLQFLSAEYLNVVIGFIGLTLAFIVRRYSSHNINRIPTQNRHFSKRRKSIASKLTKPN